MLIAILSHTWGGEIGSKVLHVTGLVSDVARLAQSKLSGGTTHRT